MRKTALITAIALAAVLLLPACSGNQAGPASSAAAQSGAAAAEVPEGDGPFGKFAEPVTISLGGKVNPNIAFEDGDSVENNFFTREIESQFNIKVEYEWLCAPADYDQKVNLAISSNALPDAFVVGMTPYNAMARFDQLQDMTATFDAYACDLLKAFYNSGGEALDQISRMDGKLMCVPAPAIKSGGFNSMWIRQDWLDKLNLAAPTTMNEVLAVAKAFVEQDPDGNGQADTIGIGGPAKNGKIAQAGGNQYGLDPLFGAYQSFPCYWLRDDSGQVVYGSTQPETKEALTVLAQMYADGLIDKEMLIREDSLQPILDNKTGIFFGPWWTGYTLADNIKQETPADWQAYAYPVAADGKFYAHMSPPADSFVVVRKDYEHPAAVLKIINLLLRDEQKWVAEGSYYSTGMGDIYPLFAIFDNADEIEVSYQLLHQFINGEIAKDDVDYSTHKLLRGDMDAIEVLKKEPYDDFSIRNWDSAHDLAAGNLPRLISIMVGGKPLAVEQNIVEVYSLTYAKTDTMTSRWANLEKLETETFAKIIMGQEPVDAFDVFVQDWHAQGGDKILQEVTEIAG